jgi:BirA family biotin operon repressor/biotin-[acetyl-CoA-carboxylase] ligase
MEFNIIHIPQVDSTNSYARQLIASNNANEGDVIIADHQTAGVGQGDNFWESEKGKNLTMSIVIEPVFIEASNQFVLTQVVSLALSYAIGKILNEDQVLIKWPNDVYIDNKKIAGVLIQNFIFGNTLSYSVIGIGININQTIFLSDAPNPVSLSNISSKIYDLNEIRDAVLREFSNLYNENYISYNKGKLKENYLNKLYRRGVLSEFIDETGRYYGKIIDVDEFGRLLISKDNNTVSRYLLKEVQMVI